MTRFAYSQLNKAIWKNYGYVYYVSALASAVQWDLFSLFILFFILLFDHIHYVRNFLLSSIAKFCCCCCFTGTGFTRPYQLSPQLAAVVGSDCLPRHEVVKRVWAIINERNLYDPKNKQFAICDSQLQTVMGVKRFRTFAMLKYLKTHFLG